MANRTSITGGRGPGLNDSIEIWTELKRKFPKLRLTTDFHEVNQIAHLSHLIDVAQIPAFLCRQTDLICECAKVFKTINIKNGQWLRPNNLNVSIDKIKSTNPNCQAWITDRGSNFGYHDLFVNFGIVDELRKVYDKVILDCTHSTQGSRSVYGMQGDPELAKRYFQASTIFKYDGLFAELHPNPKESISDADCAIQLDEISALVEIQKAIRNLKIS